MKLKSIQLYQAVMWQKSNTLFITNQRQGHESTEITMKGDHIHIKSATDEIIVFPTNVAYAVPVGAPQKADSESQLRDVKPKGR